DDGVDAHAPRGEIEGMGPDETVDGGESGAGGVPSPPGAKAGQARDMDDDAATARSHRRGRSFHPALSVVDRYQEHVRAVAGNEGVARRTHDDDVGVRKVRN